MSTWYANFHVCQHSLSLHTWFHWIPTFEFWDEVDNTENLHFSTKDLQLLYILRNSGRGDFWQNTMILELQVCGNLFTQKFLNDTYSVVGLLWWCTTWMIRLESCFVTTVKGSTNKKLTKLQINSQVVFYGTYIASAAALEARKEQLNYWLLL